MFTRLMMLFAALALAGCAALQPNDPLRVEVVGIEPAESQGLELRLAIKLHGHEAKEKDMLTGLDHLNIV